MQRHGNENKPGQSFRVQQGEAGKERGIRKGLGTLDGPSPKAARRGECCSYEDGILRTYRVLGIP